MKHSLSLKKSKTSILWPWAKSRNKLAKVDRFSVKKIIPLEILLLVCDFLYFSSNHFFRNFNAFLITEHTNNSRNRHLNLRWWSNIRPFISSPLDLIKKHQSFGSDCVMRPSMINHGPMSIDSLNDRTVPWSLHWFLVFGTLGEKNWLIDFFIWS